MSKNNTNTNFIVMPVFYKLHKVVRTFKDGRQDKANNRWYAKAIQVSTVSTDELAERISYSTTVTPSDTVAVLKALGVVMAETMAESHAVKLEGIGTFKIGISSKGSETVEEFTVNTNIRSLHVNFTPEYTVNRANGTRHTALTAKAKVKETAYNDVERE